MTKKHIGDCYVGSEFESLVYAGIEREGFWAQITYMSKVLFKSTPIACAAGQCSIPVQQ